MLWFLPQIRIHIIHIVSIWVLLYNVLENYRKNCNVSLLCRSNGLCKLRKPRYCAVAWHSFDSRELNFYVMIPSLEMDKGHHYKAAACEIKRNNRNHLYKHFEPDCFKTEGVYPFDTSYLCMRSVLKPHSFASAHLQGTSLE